jgi:hypothetical protein
MIEKTEPLDALYRLLSYAREEAVSQSLFMVAYLLNIALQDLEQARGAPLDLVAGSSSGKA